MEYSSQPRTCECGSGIPGNECCHKLNQCKVIHFPWGKKNQYKNLVDIVLNDLVSYVKAYFYNYKDNALSKFISFASTEKLDEDYSPIFWHWYVLNYRCYKDVSPIIDFYISEKADKVDEKYYQVLQALKNSYLSLYRVKWVNNNVVCLQDTWLGYEYIVERSFGSVTRLVTDGSLLLARIVVIGNSALLAGKVILVQPDQLGYILEEMESVRTNERIQDRRLFIQEYGEVLVGLIIDLSQGIKKNRIKAKTLHLEKNELKTVSKALLQNSSFDIIERNKSWLKLKFNKGRGPFNRVYLYHNFLSVVGEAIEEINVIIENINLRKLGIYSNWTDGFSFETEEEAEELLLEVMHDRYLDEWLNSPHLELDNMTPLQAVTDIKGRALLDTLLKKLELLELRAKSKNEYYVPTSAIRARLKLDKYQLNKEMLHPDAVNIKVRKHRLHQELSPFVTAYNWFNEDYRKVGIKAFDWFYPDKDEREKLAWILFMWNEYCHIYYPRVSLPKAILAALEYTYYKLNGAKLSYAWLGKKYQVSSSLISKNAQLILRHFEKYPLDFKVPVVEYPRWDELNDSEKINAYDEIWQHLYLFTYGLKHWEENQEASKLKFYSVVNEHQKFWTQDLKKLFDEFYKHHYMLDYRNEKRLTIANMFWENQAKRFPHYLKIAAFNIMMSYVGVYRIYPEGFNNLIFEDYFTGKTYKAYGNFGFNVHESIVPGMLGITRLLPLGDKVWVNDPMYIVLPDLIELFEKHLQILLEKYHPYDPTDYQYLKKRGELAVKAHILSMDEVEQNAVNLITQPLQIEWYKAGIINYDLIVKLLSKSNKMKLLSQNSKCTTFLWMSFNASQYYHWGYVIVYRDKILITTPPGKDLQKFIRDIRAALKNEDIVISFRPLEASFPQMKKLENYLIKDLAVFFNNNPELSLALLRQDELGDEELEWQQGIFLLKLGALLMDYIEGLKTSPVKTF